MNISSGVITVLLVAVIIIFIAVVAVYSISSTRRETKRRADEAQGLGFQALPREDYRALLQKLAQVNPRLGKSYMELRNVFHKPSPEGRIFIYDLWNNGGEDSSSVQVQAIGMAVEGIEFPRFLITANLVGQSGILAGLASKVITWVFQQSLPLVDFSDYPEFSQQVNVGCEDASAIRQLLTPDVMHRLMGNRDLFLAGCGDMLVYSPIFGARLGNMEPATLAHKLDSALSVMRILLD
jgi:hypothetical protein